MSFHSLHSDDEQVNRFTVVLNKSRTVALEKVDRAPFSYVLPKIWVLQSLTIGILGCSM